MRDEKATVERLIKKYQTNDPFRIAREMGITIFFERLKDSMGFYNRYKRMAMIHINQDLPRQKQRFVCAHELGHAILHPGVNTPFLNKYTLFSVSKIEAKANAFAVELLLPDSVLHEYADCSFSNIAAQSGIPEHLTELKQGIVSKGRC